MEVYHTHMEALVKANSLPWKTPMIKELYHQEEEKHQSEEQQQKNLEEESKGNRKNSLCWAILRFKLPFPYFNMVCRRYTNLHEKFCKDLISK
eukprot:2586358-Ditylum_brightwellii.AAC.1